MPIRPIPQKDVEEYTDWQVRNAVRLYGIGSAQAKDAAEQFCIARDLDPHERTEIIIETVSVERAMEPLPSDIQPPRYRHRWEDVLRNVIKATQ